MNLHNTIPVFEMVVNDISLIQQTTDIDVYRDTIIHYPFFQTAQLLYIISKNQVDSIFSDAELKQAAIYCGSRARLYDYLNNELIASAASRVSHTNEIHLAENIKTEIPSGISTTKVSKAQADSLIDKFIQESPSIQKPVSEFFSPSSMAAKSIEEDTSIATESYAKIFVKTGHYAKAIRIYEKLMLYYPEKSNYFATLIESLKDKINE